SESAKHAQATSPTHSQATARSTLRHHLEALERPGIIAVWFMFVTAIIAAGGRGQRLGAAGLKQLLPVGGTPMLERSVAAFLSHPIVDEVIVALPADLAEAPPPYLLDTPKPLKVVAGGARRQDSVGNAFRAASPHADIVVIHDAARPFVSAELIGRTIAAAVESGAALAALQARDTVKLAGPA